MRECGLGLGLSRNDDSVLSDYFDRLAAAGGTISPSAQTALTNWFNASVGYRSKIKRCNFFLSNFAGLMVPQIRNGGSANDANTAFVSGDFSLATGLTGNGSSKCLNTGFDPKSLGYSAYSFGMGVYLCGGTPVFTDDAAPMGTYNGLGERVDFGLTNAAAPDIIWKSILGVGATGLCTEVYNEALLGFYAVGGEFPETGTSTVRSFRNGIGGVSAASAEWTTAIGNVTPFALNLIGTPSRFWPGPMGAYLLFSGMTYAEHAAMYTHLQTLMTALGRP